MGWVSLLLIGAIATVALAALRVPRMAWTSVGAALMLAVIGYALQGRPDIPEQRAMPQEAAVAIDPSDVILRDEMFGGYHNGTAFLGAADALMRSGEPRTAARATLGGVQAYPDNFALWTELGTTLAAADGGNLSPAASFAFDRAIRMAPDHPGPHYFLGLAELGAGQVAAARAQWQAAYRLSGAGAPYRAKLADRIARLDQFAARIEQQQRLQQRALGQ